MDFYTLVFSVLVGICTLLQIFIKWNSSNSTSTSNQETQSKTTIASNDSYISFRNSYLFVYFLVMLSDWLQGPYVYKLYQAYGFQQSDIAELFIAGYFSSLLFGTVTGSLADKLGRKWGCLLFGFIYSVSCITKLSSSYVVLMFGRLTGGIGTSLLFSVFESWMQHEHKARKFTDDQLCQTFSYAVLGNGIVAIFAGVLGSVLVDLTGSFVSPWLLSLAILIFVSAYVWYNWNENYGDSRIEFSQTMSNALTDICSGFRVPLLGFVQALFEASMYTFVFMWTPSLEATLPEGEVIPHGMIFATFMLATMIGSSVFSLLASFVKMETIGILTLILAAVSHALPAFTEWRFIAFLLFEVCCGLYWPCFGALRGRYLNERSRSAVMNLFRVPLNLLVVLVLLRVQFLTVETVFIVTTIWLGTAALMQTVLRLTAQN